MAVIYIKPGGTKTATGSGDYASTADDWSNANCYDNLHMVGFNIVSGSPADYIIADDEIIFDSNVVAPIVHDLNYTRVRDIGPTGTVTMKSRTGNADDCLLTGSNAAASDLMLNSNTAGINFILEDLTITKSVTHTDNNSPNIYMTSETGNVRWRRVKFKGFTSVCPANTLGLSNVMYSELGVITHRVITFEDCSWNDIDLSYENGGNFIYIKAIAGTDTTSLVFEGANTFNNIAITATGSDSTDSISGGILTLDGVTTTINGTLTAEDYTSTVTNSTAGNYAFLRLRGVTNGNAIVTGTNITTQNGSAVSCFIHCEKSLTLNEVYSFDCETVWTNIVSQGTSGCTLLAQFTGTVVTVNKIVATRPRSKFGAAIYWSGGASVNIGSVRAIDAKVLQGPVYGGGDGDCNIDSGHISGTRQDATLITRGGDTVADYPGTDVSVLLNQTSGARDKTTIMSNFTIVDSDPASPWSVDMRSLHTTYANLVTLNNFAFDSGVPIQLHTQQVTGNGTTVTLNNCAIPTAEIDDKLDGGNFTNNNPITADPLINADGTLPEGSPLVGAGIRYWAGSANPVGVNGEPFSDLYTDIGSYQSTWSPFHPVNL